MEAIIGVGIFLVGVVVGFYSAAWGVALMVKRGDLEKKW